jgi:hypothetical protein
MIQPRLGNLLDARRRCLRAFRQTAIAACSMVRIGYAGGAGSNQQDWQHDKKSHDITP